MPTAVGLTPDAGWELNVERELRAPLDEVWQRLVAEWLPAWLGVASLPQMVGAPIADARGRVQGRVVGCHVGRRVRVRWTPADLDHETVFQVTIAEAVEGTTITVHQERLLGPAERQALLERWTRILDNLVAAIAAETGAIPQITEDDATA